MIRVAVVGTGVMGRNHVRILREMPDVQIVGVADRDLALARSVATRYGLEAYDDHQQLFDERQPEAVIVAVPTRQHVPVALAAVAIGAGVLVEKPIAHSVDEARLLVAAAKLAGVALAVGHVERFNPAVIELKKQLDRGSLGRIHLIHSRRLSPFPQRIMDVGVAADLATHELDMMRYLTGSEVVSVQAEVSQVLHPSHEDIVFGLLRFESGVLGILDVNWVTPTKVRDLSITGERGMFRVDYLAQELYFFANAGAVPSGVGSNWMLGRDFTVDEGDMTRLHIARKEPLQSELESFLGVVRNGGRPVVDGEDGIEALQLAQSIVDRGGAFTTSTPAGGTSWT